MAVDPDAVADGLGLTRFVAGEALLLKQWPGESSGLVYDALTATTHLLDALACEILRLARKGPTGVDEVVASLNGAALSDPSEVWAPADLLPTVQGLLHAGLLHPMPAVPLARTAE